MSVSSTAQSAVALTQAQTRLAIENTILKQAAQQDQQIVDLVSQAVQSGKSSSPTAPGVGGVVDRSA
ncbi:hypothetical protein [Coralliovum pocilloporae]|uniref:hypothetical protein n=1 Tax=Coralliovum pocilloporae TaxID=3066369 RepID=UPI003306AB59